MLLEDSVVERWEQAHNQATTVCLQHLQERSRHSQLRLHLQGNGIENHGEVVLQDRSMFDLETTRPWWMEEVPFKEGVGLTP